MEHLDNEEINDDDDDGDKTTKYSDSSFTKLRFTKHELFIFLAIV